MEEIQKNKSNKWLIIIIILAVLLLVSLGCLGYGYIKYDEINGKYQDLSDEYQDLSNKYNEVNKNLEETKKQNNDVKNYIVSSHGYNIYADYDYAMVIGYEGWLYNVSANSDATDCASEFVYYKKENKVKDDKYICEESSEYSMNSYVSKTNIKEDDIYKAVIFNFPVSTDAQYSTFYILKTGEVKYSHTGGDLIPVKAFNNYKIKDITKFYCTNGNKLTCSGLQADVVLQDGTKKVIDNIKDLR